MKKILFLSVFTALSFLGFAQEEPREVPVESFTELVSAEEFTPVAEDFSNIFNQFTEDVKANDKGPWGVVLLIISLISSLLAFGRKHWPLFKKIFQKAKGDTVVLIFALIGGTGWALLDLQVTPEELLLRISTVFTVAVTLFKIGLGKLWERLFNRNDTPAPTPQP